MSIVVSELKNSAAQVVISAGLAVPGRQSTAVDTNSAYFKPGHDLCRDGSVTVSWL